MTLDQLRIFVTVANLQHVTRAAQALNLTQSSVSSAISALEARHDIVLFNRVGRGIELTTEGAAFLESANAVLAAARLAEATLADLSGLRQGSLSIFASQTIANFWLPGRLVGFLERHPALHLDVSIGNTAECVKAVLSGAAEIGLIEGEAEEHALTARLVTQDRLVLIVGRQHQWATAQPRLPRDLTATGWVMRETGSGTRSSFESALTQAGIAPAELSVALELPSNEAVCAAVAAGRLAAVVSETVARSGVASGELVAIPLEMAAREFRVIQHRSRRLSRAGAAFTQMLLDQGGRSG